MINSLKWLYLSIAAFIATIFGLVHQKLYTAGGWFCWEQLWHHEPLIAMAFVGFIILLVVYLVGMNKKTVPRGNKGACQHR